MTDWALVVFFVLITIWYLTFLATRLDRLHHRVENSWANLDVLLQKRAAVALEIAHSDIADPASSLLLTGAAYQARDAQYLLLKAPPASGKSRALMFIALDKLVHQGLKKVIVAVPEKSIGGSFQYTNLKESGFFASWEPNDEYNLCTRNGWK